MNIVKSVITGIALIFLFFNGRSQSVSPEVIATAGDFFTGLTASISWTLGEPVIETYSGTAGTLTQGFQQDWQSPDGIIEAEFNPDISIYPNPFYDQLTIHSSVFCFVTVRDVIGRTVFGTTTIIAGSNSVNLSSLEAGTYFIVFTNNQHQSISKKIIKK